MTKRREDYWKEVTSLVDASLISTVVKGPGFSRKPPPYGAVTIRHDSLQLRRQIKDGTSDLAEEISETSQKPV